MVAIYAGCLGMKGLTLGNSLHAILLDPGYSQLHCDTCEIRVRREACKLLSAVNKATNR